MKRKINHLPFVGLEGLTSPLACHRPKMFKIFGRCLTLSSTPFGHHLLCRFLENLCRICAESLLKKKEVLEHQALQISICRGDRTRTCDTLVPNQVRYRTALHPECHPFSELRCKGINIILTLQIKEHLFYHLLKIWSILEFIFQENRIHAPFSHTKR